LESSKSEVLDLQGQLDYLGVALALEEPDEELLELMRECARRAR
jgi:hypothetical protein